MNTGYLGEVFPFLRRFRIPVTRDQAMLFLIAVNQILLGVETYLAHSISGTIVMREWIPILFGPVVGVLLLLAGAIAFRQRMVANIIGTVVFLASIVVGLLGSYYHIIRAVLPNAPAGERVSLLLLIWAPPLLGPITFALIGILGLSAAWQEEPKDSGRLKLPGGISLQLPYSKTRAYFFLIGLGTLITVLSSMLDHARSSFENPFVWIPTIAGIFATAVMIAPAFFEHLSVSDLRIYTGTVILLILVGVMGSGLHLYEDVTAAQGAIVIERLIRGAPVMAPMLFANMAAFGMLILLDGSNDVPPRIVKGGNP